MRRYTEITELICKRIEAGTLKVGDRLPSVRQLHESSGFSSTTIRHAYAQLEGSGIINARPRSGFFVARNPGAHVRPTTSTAHVDPGGDATEEPIDFAYRLSSLWHRRDLECFGALYPARDLFSPMRLDRHLRNALRAKTRNTQEIFSPEGDPLLREAVARRAISKGIIARPSDVSIMGRGIQGLDLEEITNPGDEILIESPTFYPVFAALKRRNLMVTEIHSDPVRGVDPAEFEELLKSRPIKACVLMPTHHFPTGTSSSAETMRRIVSAATERAIPIVELDLFGELTYGGSAVSSLKKFDEADLVIHFSSLGGLSAHGYGLSNIISRRYQSTLARKRFMSVLSSGEGIVQRATAEYVLNSGYDRHIRRARTMLKSRVATGLRLLGELAPFAKSISRPAGGFMCWVEIGDRCDAEHASQLALAQGITLPFGQMFSAKTTLEGSFGLNLSFEWTDANIEKLRQVCRLMEPAR